MAKELGSFELVIRGTDTAPTQMFRRYIVADSGDPELCKHIDESVGTPDFNKVSHNTGAVGELWRDEVDIAKTNEGI